MFVIQQHFNVLLKLFIVFSLFLLLDGKSAGFGVSEIADVHFSPENVFNLHPKAVKVTVNVFSKVFHIELVHSSSVAPYFYSKSPSNPISCHYEGYASSYDKSDAAFSLCSPEDAYGVISFNGTAFMVMNACIDHHACTRNSQYNFTVHGDVSSLAGRSGPLAARNFLLQRARRAVYAAPNSLLKLGEPSNLKILGENAETLYIRLLVASDPKQFSNNNNIKPQTERRAMQIANVAALLMRPLNVVLYVMEHRVLSSRDVSSDNIKELLSQIEKYRSTNIDPVRNDIDVVHVLTSSKFDPKTAESEDADLLGQAYVAGICSRYAVSFSADLINSIVQVGATMAHEIGHLLGLSHDKPGCVCPFSDLSSDSSPKIVNSTSCIMVAAKAVSGAQPLAWSNCSLAKFAENRKQLPPYCLRQRPVLSSIKKFCGNGVVEEDEQCDCGSPDLVNTWADVAIDNVNQKPPCSLDCCDMSTCQFSRKNVTCATGACCNLGTCQLLPKHTECRKAISECDLPEYCSGQSESCPRDLHKATGYSCESDSNSPSGAVRGLCFAGHCHSRSAQCRRLWGPSATDGKASCYAKNKEGSPYANCGHTRITYDDNEDAETKKKRVVVKCPTIEDSFCGTLQCIGMSSSTTAMPLLSAPLTYEIRSDGCGYVLGALLPDYGLVRNGTKCVPHGSPEFDGICLNNLCVSLNDTAKIIAATFEAEGLLGELSSFTTDNYPRGAVSSGCGCSDSRCVCNSVGSRHCAPGYEPPSCSSSGCGGSVESNSAGLCSRDDSSGHSNSAVIAIAVLATVLGLGIIVVILVLAIGRRRIAEMWYSSRLFVEVEQLRDRFTSVRPPSGTRPKSNPPIQRATDTSTGTRRSLRGPPGPAPITTVSSGNNGFVETANGYATSFREEPSVEIRQHNHNAVVNINRIGASPTLNHRVASAPVQRTNSAVNAPHRPPAPKSAAVVRPNVPPPPVPQEKPSPTDDDNLPLSVADAARRFGGGVKKDNNGMVGAGRAVNNRTPPQDSVAGQWFNNVLKRNHETRTATTTNQSPVMQRQPMLQTDNNNNKNSNFQRRPSLGGTNPVQMTRVYPQ